MTFRVPLTSQRLRLLDVDDMERMRVGRKHWGVRFDDIPDECSYKKELRDFIADLKKNIDGGNGLVFHGEYGRGKTGAAVLIMKEVVARGGSALLLGVDEVQQAVITRAPFDEETTLIDRANEVDLLVLDDMNREYVKEFGKTAIETLIRRRYDNGLAIVITTNASPAELGKTYEAAMQALRERTKVVMCQGKNWRAPGETA